jgi:hypothetical protein
LPFGSEAPLLGDLAKDILRKILFEIWWSEGGCAVGKSGGDGFGEFGNFGLD